ncbi:tetratricopeptide repeat-containing sensor histidine kinase [Aureispira sp. CCB-E]|uniref:tetratricopeptide repeat-containing sensor histidine kinase n=1 Tax=Aureispira sp. CCB-E TaxID=3051121 RepID=UPI0028685DDD|nr:tetratricopeptide repeat-containing sensor histidine kinase [Aureispira sp. CCB-E]WMX12073.1 tetratricopeptide repeat-containing sensor histidine kinase [Aureispira sp. CCB-E]
MHHQLILVLILVMAFPKLILTKSPLSQLTLSNYRNYVLFFVLLFVFSVPKSFAQEKDKPEAQHNHVDKALINRLSQKIEQAENDSIKTTYIMKLAYAYLYHVPDSTINVARRGLNILEGDTSSWVPAIQVQLIAFVGHAHRFGSNFTAAVNAFQKMLAYSISWNDSNLIVQSYFNIAASYAEQEKHDSAVIFDLKALEIQEATHSNQLGKSYNSVGLDYLNAKLFDQALIYFNKSIALKKKNKQDNLLGNTYFNLGTTYRDLAKQDSALYFYELALKNAKIYKDSIFIMQSLEAIGIIHSINGDYARAKEYLLQAISLFNFLKLPYNSRIVNSYQELARVYITESNFEKAEKLLNKSKQILYNNKASISNRMKQNLELWQLLAWSKKDFANARIYSQEYADLIDTLHQRNIDQKVYKLLLTYEDQLKEQRIKSLEQQQEISNLKNERLNQSLYFMVIIIIVMLLIVGFLYRLNKWRSKVNLELETLNNTKDKLFSIIAHDLKNPLSAFRSITQSLSEDIFDISRDDLDYFIKQLNTSASNLFDLLQNLLYWSISQTGRLEFQPQKITLTETTDDVFSLLESSANIKNIGLSNTISTETVAWADQKMTHTILRNLIANAIKFTPNGGNISVSSNINNSMLTISVTDTGKGIPPHIAPTLFMLNSSKNERNEVEGKGTGLGLILCKELVEQQGGNIWLEDTSSLGSTFSFTLPTPSKNI